MVDRLTKSTHFLAIKETDKMEKLTKTYINELVRLHEVPICRDLYQLKATWVMRIILKQIDGMKGRYNP